MRRLHHPRYIYLLGIACVTLCGYILIFIRLESLQLYDDNAKSDGEVLDLIRKMREHGYMNSSVINMIDTRIKADLNISHFLNGMEFYNEIDPYHTVLSKYKRISKYINKLQEMRDNMSSHITRINSHEIIDGKNIPKYGHVNLENYINNRESDTHIRGDQGQHNIESNRERQHKFGEELADTVLNINVEVKSQNDADKQLISNDLLNADDGRIINRMDTEESDTQGLISDNNTVNESFDITDNDDHIYLVENPNYAKSGKSNYKYAFDTHYNEVLNETYTYRKRIYSTFYKSDISVNNVDCAGILNGDVNAIHNSQRFMSETPKHIISPMKYTHIRNCDKFKRTRGYIDHPLTRKEREFPLAYALIVYKSIEQVERLLRAIYRPQNYYCIHVDLKSKPEYTLALRSIAGCFNNVFTADKSLNVTWGDFSVLEAELECLRALWKYEKWIYYINLTGQEFPLKTNLEIVEILTAMHGANVVDGTWVRARQKYFYRWTQAGDRPPHQIRPIKGSVHVVINRPMAEFALHDRRAQDFLEWLKKTQIPDETFFPSLNHNPHLGIIGSFLGEPEEYPLKPAFMRYKNWEVEHGVWARSCSGKYVRHICILGVGDVSKAIADIGLFVNKFHIDFEYLALDCVEEWLYKRTWDQYLNNAQIDVTFYEHLDQVKYQLKEKGDLP